MSVIEVSNATQLRQALAHAAGGDTIQLSAGSYGDLRLDGVSFASDVKITSAGPTRATFSGLDLHNVSHLTVSNVKFDYDFKVGDPSYISPFSIYGGDHINISKSVFDGGIAKGTGSGFDHYGYGNGLMITNAQDVQVTGNHMYNFYAGMKVSDSKHVTIGNNDIHAIRSDAMDFVHVQSVNIIGNHIHDFRTAADSLDHPDMIQFWTAGTTAPSTHIVIRGNFLDAGEGTWTQSIFMGNEMAGAGKSMYYRDVTIANNVIVNGHLHGITVGAAIGVRIMHNSVLHTDSSNPDGADPGVEIPQINVVSLSQDVLIRNNITAGLSGYHGQKGWVVDENFIAQDQNAKGAHYYGNLFTAASLTATNGQHVFVALAGGLIDQAFAGARATRSDQSHSQMTGDTASLTTAANAGMHSATAKSGAGQDSFDFRLTPIHHQAVFTGHHIPEPSRSVDPSLLDLVSAAAPVQDDLSAFHLTEIWSI